MKTILAIIAGLCFVVSATAASPVATLADAPSASSHRFFDRQNVVLFSSLAVTKALDLASTWRFRARGNDEVILNNALVDNKPGFAAYTATMMAAHIGGCYLLHRTGHHRLERIFSYVQIGSQTLIDVHNYRL